MKVLRVEQNGWVWEVPAKLIAENRAKYYAEKDRDTTYEEEYEYTINSNEELYDWYMNNMDWDDVSDEAELVERPEEPQGPDWSEDFESEFVER